MKGYISTFYMYYERKEEEEKKKKYVFITLLDKQEERVLCGATCYPKGLGTTAKISRGTFFLFAWFFLFDTL
jgi:hypothetical protein